MSKRAPVKVEHPHAESTASAERWWLADVLPVVVIVVLGSLLLFSNLGQQSLWQDEAETAVVSETVLTHGLPMGTDGVNSFSQALGADYDKSMVHKWHPWLMFYVTAASFAVLGPSTFSARLPFALFGLATCVLMYFFGKRMFGSRRAGILAALVILANVPFLILARQCRYYSLDAFFATLGLYGYYSLLEKRKWSGLTFFLGGFFLFHAQYVHCAVLLATVMLHCLIWRRDRLLAVMALSGLVTLLNVPWMIWFAGMRGQLEAYGTLAYRLQTFGPVLLARITEYIYPTLVMVLAALIFFVEWVRLDRMPKPDRKSVSDVSLILILVVISTAAAMLTVTWPFFRVLACMIPATLLLVALTIESSMKKLHVAVGIAVILLLGYGMRMPAYFYELTHEFRGPIDGIVKYLNENGKPGETVAISYGDMPIKFYTKMRVYGGLTGENLAPAKTADWVIIRAFDVGNDDKAVKEYLMRNVDSSKYKPVVLDYPDTPFENREEPSEHLFLTQRKVAPVIIFRRIEK